MTTEREMLTEKGWFIAARFGDVAKVRQYLAAGANPNAVDSLGWTALEWVALSNYPEVAKDLVAAGADPNLVTKDNKTALSIAKGKGHAEIVRILEASLTKGQRQQTSTALPSQHQSVQSTSSPTKLKDPTIIERNRMVKDNDIVKLQQAISDGMNLDVADYEEHTVLHGTALFNRPEMAKVLLSAGANPNATNFTHHTPLMIATMAGHSEVVKVLLAAGADANMVDMFGWTALKHAQEKEYAEIVRILGEYSSFWNRVKCWF